MAKIAAKKTFPVGNIRRYLEPGPIVLVSSRWRGKTNIMMGLGSVTYNITANPDTGPYLLGHIGYLNAKASVDDLDTEGEGGVAFGGGLGYGMGKFWLEGRYITASLDGGTLAIIMIGAGISF